MKSATLLKIFAALNTLILLLFLYKSAFSLWMTAHPVYANEWWKHRFYFNIGVTLMLITLEVFFVWKLVRGYLHSSSHG